MKKIMLIAGAFLFPLTACSASFDCNKAASPTEKLICNNETVSKLDEQLASAYKQALESATDKDAVKKARVEWLKQQRACKDADCLVDVYKFRIESLNKNAISAMSGFEKYSLIDGKNGVCDAFGRYLNKIKIPEGQSSVENVGSFNEDEENLYKLPDGSELKASVFDYDNDGKNDQVFIKGYDGRYMWGAKIFVRENSIMQDWSRKEIIAKELSVYPCQYDKSKPSSEMCPPFSQKADDAGVTYEVNEGNENIFFRGRYTSLMPMTYKGVTYLTLDSMQNNYAIIKPLPKNKYSSMCLFKKIN